MLDRNCSRERLRQRFRRAQQRPQLSRVTAKNVFLVSYLEQKLHKLVIPKTGDAPLEITIDRGDTLFVVGANGAGKSSLMQHFCAQHRATSHRISAHRQTWFTSDTSDITPHSKKQTEQNIQSIDSRPESRWKDDYAAARAGIAIYDLIDAENIRARKIASEVDRGDLEAARSVAREPAPITVINELLRSSNLPITVSVHESERVMASKNGSSPFSIAELSDGERNALLIAASVLTVKPGTLILIDEPERHLHRSIISPLLTHMFASRPDCAFVVSTHEILLCSDHPKSSTLLVRGCSYNDRQVESWDTDLLPPELDVDENLKQHILGSRRKVLFVEGTMESLDKPLYAILFPDCSVISAMSCRDVEHLVRSIRTSSSLHWVSAWGVIDRDDRPFEILESLKNEHIFATDCYSVESLYYDPEILRMIVERQSAVMGGDVDSTTREAIRMAIKSIEAHSVRLSARAAEKEVRHRVLCSMPTHSQIQAGTTISIDIDASAILMQIKQNFESLISSQDFRGLLRRFPIRETAAFNEIVTRVGFRRRIDYEKAVLKLVAEDERAREVMYGFLNGAAASINTR